MKPVDGQAVWSIVCFVVPSEFRKQGVARELLAGAVEYARKRGVRLLEASRRQGRADGERCTVVRLEDDVRRSAVSRSGAAQTGAADRADEAG
jgi:GNAT superfamily N-acetyltransferase